MIISIINFKKYVDSVLKVCYSKFCSEQIEQKIEYQPVKDSG